MAPVAAAANLMTVFDRYLVAGFVDDNTSVAWADPGGGGTGPFPPPWNCQIINFNLDF